MCFKVSCAIAFSDSKQPYCTILKMRIITVRVLQSTHWRHYIPKKGTGASVYNGVLCNQRTMCTKEHITDWFILLECARAFQIYIPESISDCCVQSLLLFAHVYQ